MTGDLTVWLRAQLDADEKTAEAETQFRDGDPYFSDPGEASSFERRFDPAFTLADITAKRTIIDLHQTIAAAYPGATVETQPCCAICSAGGEYPGQFPCATLRLLAQPYAGRPGWHNEWTTT